MSRPASRGRSAGSEPTRPASRGWPSAPRGIGPPMEKPTVSFRHRTCASMTRLMVACSCFFPSLARLFAVAPSFWL